MGLMDGLKIIGEIKHLTVERDGDKLECSDWLIAALGLGLLAVIGGAVYQCSDKVGDWIRAATGRDGKVDEEKLMTFIKEYEKTHAKP